MTLCTCILRKVRAMPINRKQNRYVAQLIHNCTTFPSRKQPPKMSDLCPVYAPFFSAMVSSGPFRHYVNDAQCHSPVWFPEQGCTSAIVFTCEFNGFY